MNWQKISDGLFVDFDKVTVLQFELQKMYNEQDGVMERKLLVNGVIDGAKILLFGAEVADDSEKALKNAGKQCEAFVQEHFMRGKK